jgi:hypothetical protein
VKSCCQYHSAIRPQGCNQGRDCPARKGSKLDGLFRSKNFVLVFLLFAFALSGSLEFADIEHAEQAAKQEQVKTARADQ